MLTPNRFTLPTVSFIAGTSVPFVFNTYQRLSDQPYNILQCSATFSFIDYLSEDHISAASTPKTMTKVSNNTAFQTTLTPDETKNLNGKYIYQVEIVGGSNMKEIYQGVMYVYNNINN